MNKIIRNSLPRGEFHITESLKLSRLISKRSTEHKALVRNILQHWSIKLEEVVGTGSSWLRIGTGGGNLWVR
jgi:hypothetical protein